VERREQLLQVRQISSFKKENNTLTQAGSPGYVGMVSLSRDCLALEAK
jgi:hypothetical protein